MGRERKWGERGGRERCGLVFGELMVVVVVVVVLGWGDGGGVGAGWWG